MRIATCLGVVLAFWLPARALAQDGLGLDLSEDTKKEEAPPATPPAVPDPLVRAPATPAEPHLSEVDIASEDRVKSVARKGFLKKGRADLLAMGFVSLNDSYFPKAGPSLRASYHFHDSFGVGLRLMQYNKLPNDNVRLAKRQLQSNLPSVLPRYSFAVDLLWSAVYGKVAVGNAIRHFDLYLTGGVGAVLSQTSFGEAPSGGDGPHLSTHIGVGQRFTVTDWMAVDVFAVDTLYPDRPNGQNKSVLQHALTGHAGLSFFFPTSFEYKEP